MTSNDMKTPAESLGKVFAEDESLMLDLAGLKDGTISWDDIADVPGVDVETGKPIPAGKFEA